MAARCTAQRTLRHIYVIAHLLQPLYHSSLNYNMAPPPPPPPPPAAAAVADDDDDDDDAVPIIASLKYAIVAEKVA